MAPADTTVSFAAREAAGCRVNGYVTTRDPGPNKVLFVLALPDGFNGRYVYLGVGGAAGQLPAIPRDLFSEGYALAGSDGGSGAKNGADFSFMSDPAKAADFRGRGVKVSAEATQAIAKTYYQREKLYRYISGCSGGGQMGLTNARRFGGSNFDGFLVGATPWPVSAYMPHVFRAARQMQTKPESWISPQLTKLAHAAILQAYDTSDGATDGIVADQRNIQSLDISILKASGFTPAQIETFNLIRQPYRYSVTGIRGGVLHPGYPFTDVAGWSSFLLGSKTPPWPGTGPASPGELMVSGAPYIHIMADTMTKAHSPGLDYWSIAKLDELVRVASRAGGDMPYEDPMDFGGLASSGSKMIVYHGVNDQAMSYLETVAGYEALLARYPDGRSWLRTFVIPGMLHCRGGVGPSEPDKQLLKALVAWVEKGEAPETVVTPRISPAKGLERSFRLCAEPNRSVLKSAGLDFNDADNWECRAPGG